MNTPKFTVDDLPERLAKLIKTAQEKRFDYPRAARYELQQNAHIPLAQMEVVPSDEYQVFGEPIKPKLRTAGVYSKPNGVQLIGRFGKFYLREEAILALVRQQLLCRLQKEKNGREIVSVEPIIPVPVYPPFERLELEPVKPELAVRIPTDDEMEAYRTLSTTIKDSNRFEGLIVSPLLLVYINEFWDDFRDVVNGDGK